MGDIEGMFHQVWVSPKHHDALHFLWWKNGEIGGEVEVYRMCVHLFGGVWSPSCASFALRRVANDHRMDFPEETIQAVLNNFYADDCLKSVGTTEEAINIVHSLCKLLALRILDWQYDCPSIYLQLQKEVPNLCGEPVVCHSRWVNAETVEEGWHKGQPRWYLQRFEGVWNNFQSLVARSRIPLARWVCLAYQSSCDRNCSGRWGSKESS